MTNTLLLVFPPRDDNCAEPETEVDLLWGLLEDVLKCMPSGTAIPDELGARLGAALDARRE